MIWRSKAACRGMNPDLWFPERGEDSAAAKAVCATCPVQAECRQHAYDLGETLGVWGGLSGRQRRRQKEEPRTNRYRPAACGTESGYKRHRNRNEPACDLCKAANNQIKRIRTSTRKEQVAA